MPHFRFIFAVLAALAASRPVRADEFSWELSFLASETETGPSYDTEHAALEATHFFDPVDDANGPYALAVFLDPATRVSATFVDEKETYTDPSLMFPGYVTTAHAYTVSGRHVLPRSKWYFGGTYMTSDIEPPSVSLQEVDSMSYGLLAGKYFGAATALEVTYDSSERETEAPIRVCAGLNPLYCVGTSTDEEQRDHASLHVFHVGRVRSMTYSVSGRIAESSGEGTVHFSSGAPPIQLSRHRLRSYSVGGELFPTAKLGVRVGYSRWDDDTPAEDAYDVATTWFVRRDLGVQFVFSKRTVDFPGFSYRGVEFENADASTVRVIGRF